MARQRTPPLCPHTHRYLSSLSFFLYVYTYGNLRYPVCARRYAYASKALFLAPQNPNQHPHQKRPFCPRIKLLVHLSWSRPIYFLRHPHPTPSRVPNRSHRQLMPHLPYSLQASFSLNASNSQVRSRDLRHTTTNMQVTTPAKTFFKLFLSASRVCALTCTSSPKTTDTPRRATNFPRRKTPGQSVAPHFAFTFGLAT